MVDPAAPADPGVLPIAFVVPLQGPTGLYGPSCLACGELAVEQLNASTGIAGRRVELVLVDAGRDPEVVAAEVGALVDAGRVEAVAGWHISAVRLAVARRVAGRVVYAYGAMHEGWDDSPGVVMLGERPANQLLPATHWMGEHLGARRWAVVGNDYVFPRVTGATTRMALRGTRSTVTSEGYVPLGTRDFSAVLADLRRRAAEGAGPDGVMMLLMGQDAVHFNRQFAAAGLDEELLRLTPAVEENALLAGGVGAQRGLWAAAAYFDSLASAEDNRLARDYYARFGRWAPPLNAVGESCYEALHFVALMGALNGSVSVDHVAAMSDGHFYEGPRGLMRLDGNLVDQEVHLAEADGMTFTVQDRIARPS